MDELAELHKEDIDLKRIETDDALRENKLPRNKDGLIFAEQHIENHNEHIDMPISNTEIKNSGNTAHINFTNIFMGGGIIRSLLLCAVCVLLVFNLFYVRKLISTSTSKDQGQAIAADNKGVETDSRTISKPGEKMTTEKTGIKAQLTPRKLNMDTVDAQDIRIDGLYDNRGNDYDEGIFAQKNGAYGIWAAEGKYSVLTGLIASNMDRDVTGLIRIYGDDRLLFTSESFDQLSKAVSVEVDISGVDLVRVEWELSEDDMGGLVFANGEMKGE